MSSPGPQSPLQGIGDAQRTTLVHLLRAMFPHDHFPDGPYERTAQAVLEAAQASRWATQTLVHGLRSLETLAGCPLAELAEQDAERLLRHVAGTTYFDFVRATAVVALYDDDEVWELLGYEGPSYDQGGYINRGFNDLDWLPEVRIEEYDGPEQLVEVAVAGISGSAGARSGPSHPGRASSRTTRTTTPVRSKGAQA